MNVVFWDKMPEDFQEEINTKTFEEPLILIVASGKVGIWKGILLHYKSYLKCIYTNYPKYSFNIIDELDICNFSPTTYYINYPHHSVLQLRKMYVNHTYFLLKIF